MNILIVGAGAVGQVYAHYLAIGGAKVSFLVRPKHAGEHADGFTLYPLRTRGTYEPVRLRPERIFTSLDDVKNETFDQVWVCVPTTALVKPWIDDVVSASGDATLVMFPAGINVAERLGLPADRCVAGLISMMSWFAPMEGEPKDITPGVAFWFPPLSPTTFSGPDARRDAVIAALKRGKCPASRGNVKEAGAFGSAVLMPHIVGLEGAGWSYDELAFSEHLANSVAATREAIAAAASHLHIKRPFLFGLLRPWTVRLLLGIIRWLAPLDVATFFKTHFTKVRAQTQMQMAQYIDLAAKEGQPTAALTKLTADVFGAGWREKQLPAASSSRA